MVKKMDKQFNVPRILIGATGSGSGKTTITCGLLKAFSDMGRRVRAYKCGPDYIDPMFHTRVLGIPSANLDLYFNDENTIRYLLDRPSDLAVMEGVMGYYDGIGGISARGSAFDLATVTETPSVLIIDGKGKSVSIVAEIKGFLEYRENSGVRGVILNRVSPSMYGDLKKIIEAELGIRVFGFFPVMEKACLESRHLGLVTADEIGNLNEIIEQISRQAEETVDLDGLLSLAEEAKPLTYTLPEIHKGSAVRIGIAKDHAFCFYYNDNLALLEEMGAELISFSPVAGDPLPADLDGLLLGGGYPELYLHALSENQGLKTAIAESIEKGMPCLAECGGFMYLHQWIEDECGERYPMTGILEGGCFPIGKLNRFGYLDMVLNEDTVAGCAGTAFKAHEFHYWDSENPGKAAHGQKPLRKRNWDAMVSYKNLLGGFPHIHYYTNLKLAENFLEACRAYGKTRGDAAVEI